MPIEFSCETCHTELRVPDSAAGGISDCPVCSHRIEIPYQSEVYFDEEPPLFEEPPGIEDASVADDWIHDPEPTPPPEPFPGPASTLEADEAWSRAALEDALLGRPESHAGASQWTCRVCNAKNPVASPTCFICDSPQPGEHRLRQHLETQREGDAVSVSRIFNESVRTFQKNFLVCLLSQFIDTIFTFVVFVVTFFIAVISAQLVGFGPDAGLAMALLGSIVTTGIASSYLLCGYYHGMLKLARGEPTTLRDFLEGHRCFGRMFVLTAAFTILWVAGLMLCIVPGLIAATLFWPYGRVLVDKDPPGMQSMTIAADLVQRNLATVVTLGLIYMGLQVLSMMTYMIGFFLTAPFGSLMLTVAYLRMTGQRTAEPA